MNLRESDSFVPNEFPPFVEIALRCCDNDADVRPKIAKVITMLEAASLN